ncbi:hypothetical protein [Nonomuraea bangladeshensis]|uniref:hypothetical protein n=1 Tax=Nonomuraea bangladeshensis TaxID=404385 RepID=UPI003C3066D7
MSDDLRQRYAEALAAKFTEPVYRCDRDGENEWVENPEPADRIGQTPYVMVTAGDGCRSFWTPSCAELAEVVAAVRDEEMDSLRARAEEADRRLAEIRRYIDEDFRFWCSPHGVAGRYAKALLDFIDRLDDQEPGRG